MNILITTYYPSNFGGAEISIELLARKLKERGNKVVFASNGDYPGFKTYLIKNNLRYLPVSLQKLYLSNLLTKIVKEENIEIIHANDRLTIPGAIKTAIKNKVPVVAHFRDYWFVCPKSSCLMPSYHKCSTCKLSNLVRCVPLRKLPQSIYKFYTLRYSLDLLDKANVKIATSKSVKDKLELCGLGNIKVISNPVDFRLFNIKDLKKSSSEKIVLTFIGTLDYHKGIMNLLKIVIPIIRENRKVSLLIVGDGPFRDKVKKIIDSSGLSNNITLLGKLPFSEMKKIYSNSDIVLFPSVWEEPFGRIAIEAMAMGKPVIASDVGGIKEIVDDKTGIKLDPFDFDGWRKSILLLLKKKKLRSDIGRRAYKKVREAYDLNRLTNDVEKVYKSILK